MTVICTIQSFLSSRHIHVSNEWITACVEWISGEHPQQNINNSSNWLKDKVYEQWLHSDITELASSTLPFGLANKRLSKINGHFALQINKIIDVGTPSYAQLQKIRKDDVQNASVSADQPHQPAWEPKPSRMLFMDLTDGSSQIKAMEYQCITSLNVNMKPGTKIIVSGNVAVRRGVLLLTRDNVTVLGGEVEALQIVNAVENVLSRKLGLEETEEPRILEAITQPDIRPSQSSQYYPSQVNNRNSNVSSQSFIRPSQSSQVNNVSSQSSIRSSQVHNRNNNSNQLFSTSNRQNNNRSITPTPSSILEDFDDNDFMDEEMEAVLNELENNTNDGSLSQSTTSANAFKSSFSNSQSTSNNNFKVPFPKAHSNNPNKKSLFTKPQQSNQNRTQLTTSQSCDQIQETSHSSIILPNYDSAFDEEDDDLFLSIDSSMDTVSQRTASTSTAQEKCINKRQKMNIASFQTDADKLPVCKGSAKNIVKASLLVQKRPPFTYLMFIPKSPKEEEDFVIKGFVMTLTTRLENAGGEWLLRVIIKDGTASCEVKIHDELLTTLIGKSVKDMSVASKSIDKNQLQREFLKSVKKCQEKLISMCGLLHIRTSPGSQYPMLIEISEVGNIHIKQLQERCKNYKH